MSDVFSSPQPRIYDGVRYGRLEHLGQSWLFGASTQSWPELLPLDGREPSPEELAALARKGLWLGREGERTPLAVMCQGMGALWPGAGRELYDEFPRAREAMDRIAAVASWDVLGLLDCRDQETIQATRWQIPYLFLLEYAQWSYLSSLGLSPSLICGHSLGELIALCFAGIYSPEVAWHILDTRAEHVARLEAQATEAFSMLAVHANLALVEDILVRYPKVRVANYNTPSQFILGGPKAVIGEIRHSLRKQRIPAVSIAVSMLFHHPAMRILRDHSLFRLNMLTMQAPSIPVLSVCKCQPYPGEQSAICQFIADLDENPVRFSDMLNVMWQDYGVRSFLELGPQEVLCGLISENLPEAQVMSPARKGHEARGLRELCARLYAEGRLREQALDKALAVYGPFFIKAEKRADGLNNAEAKVEPQPAKAASVHPLVLLLSEMTGVPASEITCELDLRKDLALRSSSFPRFLAEAEKRFHKLPSFAELVRVVTVGDLLRLFSQEGASHSAESLPLLASRLSPLVSLDTEHRLHEACYAHPYDSSKPRPSLGLVVSESLSETHWRLLLPDLLLALPGLVREIRLEPALCARLDKVLACPLPLVACQKQALADCQWLLVLGDVPRAQLTPFSAKSQRILRLVLGRKDAVLPDEPMQPNERRIVLDLRDGRRRFYELGDLLARELALGRSRSALWLARANLQADAVSSKTAPPPAFWQDEKRAEALLVPMRTPLSSQKISELAARIFFDPALPAFSGQTSVSLLQRLLPLLTVARAQTPWLDVLALTDLCVTGELRLCHGLVREGRVEVKRLAWLSLCGELHRQVVCRLALAGLSPNGRKTRQLCDHLTTTLWLGQKRATMPSLPDWVSDLEKQCQTGSAENNAAKGPLSAVACAPSGLVAWLEPLCLARSEEIPYIRGLSLLQDVVQGAFSFMHYASAPQEPLPRFAKAGFVLWSQKLTEARPRLCLRRTFSDALRERFDAVVYSKQEPLLLISQMEFVKTAD